MMPFDVTAVGLTDVGLVRQKNEDAWGLLPESHTYLLADGMGGHRAGDVAAREAVERLTAILQEQFTNRPSSKDSPFDVGHRLRLAIEETNRHVYRLSKTEDAWRGMGTTLCCLHVHDEGLVYAHVGDSRIYRLRGGELDQLTEDHSLLRELVRSGQIREQHSADFVYKNIITKALGTEPIVEPSVGVGELVSDDIYLLCSDGLSDLLSKDKIEDILASTLPLDIKAVALVDAAKGQGGYDNVTVVLIQVFARNEANYLSR
jgi:protein phosphatase